MDSDGRNATMTINYLEAGVVITALDHALCHQGKPDKAALDELRPLVDKLASTFGFPTDRLDRLLKGQKVEPFRVAFRTQRMDSAAKAWAKRKGHYVQEDSDGRRGR